MEMSFNRRTFLTGTLATAAVATVSACAAGTPGSGNTSTGSNAAAGGSMDPANPFNVAKDSQIEAVIFNGGYKTDYVDFAGEQVTKKVAAKVTVKPSTQIAQEMQPRFAAGNPPDMIDDAGAGQIGIATILDQLEDLNSVINAPNYEGKPIKDTLYDGILEPGTYNGKLAVLNYVLSVYANWYSASLFKEHGWTVPTTWDELYALGGQAKSAGKYLFLWGKEAASYYLTMWIGSAIKEGGDEIRLSFENLKPDCYSQRPMQDVLTCMKKIIDAGYVKPGGSGTQFTAAQAQWSDAQEALIYPSGAWIENEMKLHIKNNFQMTGFPDVTLTKSPKMDPNALHASGGEPYIIPSKGKNVAGGKELMRAMLSKDAAANFAKTRLAPTVVKGTIPTDGFGSTALVSQTKMLEAAGSNLFGWRFIDYYGINTANLVVLNSFLEGSMSVADLTKQLQDIVNKAANDPNVKKMDVK